MQPSHAFGLAAFTLALANCVPASAPPAVSEETAASETRRIAETTLANSDGKGIGTVALEQTGDALSLTITVNGLGPGERAFHLHTTGQCDAPDFTSAGGHLNPFGKAHGELNANGKHLGDFPNLVVIAGDPLIRTISLDGKAEELKPILFDEDGTAAMIHAGPDDYISDPAGKAGPRIACGVLKPAS